MSRSSLSSAFVALVLVCCAHHEPAAPPPSAPEPAGDDTTGSTPSSSSSGGGESADNANAGAGAATDTPPQPEPKFCEHDNECTLSLFSGCCTCCANVPHAFLKAKLANLQARCAKTMCPPCDRNCGPGPDMSAYMAVCQNKACIAVPQ